MVESSGEETRIPNRPGSAAVQPGPDRFAAYWQQRRAAQQELSQRLARQARMDVTRIAAVLRQQFGVRRIILFGSLAERRFAPGSDIDLAVEGLAKADLFAALAQVNELSRFQVDLKPLEELEPHFRRKVLTTGEELA